MHASIEDLVALNDGRHSDVLPDAKAHLANCLECQQQLESISDTLGSAAKALIEMSDHVPDADVWSRLQHSINGLPAASVGEAGQSKIAHNVVGLRSKNVQSLTRAVYALAASIAFVGLVSVFMLSGNSQNQQTQLLQASVDQLMTNSRGLEQSLQQVVQQNNDLSVANQQAADRLYWRLTYVDQLIQDANPENSEQIKVLWNNRVAALNELNKLYFEHDVVMARSEI